MPGVLSAQRYNITLAEKTGAGTGARDVKSKQQTTPA